MRLLHHSRRLGLVSAAVLGLTAGAAAAGDRVVVRGRVESVDPPTRTIKILTVSGADLTLLADDPARLSIDGKAVALDKLRPLQRVRVTYEEVGKGANRIVSLRSPVPTKADLSREIGEAMTTARAYTFAQKDKYEEKVRGVVDDVDDRIDDLRAEAKGAAADARVKLDARIEDLKRKRDELEKRLDRARPAAADAWDDVKAGVGTAADDLRKAIDLFRDEPKK